MTEKYDGIQYRCVVKSSNGTEAVSEAATASVMPVIIKQPEDVIGESGKKAVFTVKTNEKGTYTYQWQYNIGDGWKNSTADGAKTVSVSVTLDKKYDGYQYRCIVTDSNGNAITSDAAAIKIKPTITKQPENAVVEKSGVAFFEVEASGVYGLTYQWQYLDGKKWTASKDEGSKTDTLTVVCGEKNEGRKYRCVITSSNGASQTSEEVSLRPETVIVKQPEDVTVKAGEKAVFIVEGYGEGELTYEWYCRNNKKQSWEKVEGADTATLTVEADEKVNGYQYHCLVSAANGHFATTDAVELTVTGKAGREMPTVTTR